MKPQIAKNYSILDSPSDEADRKWWQHAVDLTEGYDHRRGAQPLAVADGDLPTNTGASFVPERPPTTTQSDDTGFPLISYMASSSNGMRWDSIVYSRILPPSLRFTEYHSALGQEPNGISSFPTHPIHSIQSYPIQDYSKFNQTEAIPVLSNPTRENRIIFVVCTLTSDDLGGFPGHQDLRPRSAKCMTSEASRVIRIPGSGTIGHS